MKLRVPLILASRSPRRRKLLAQLGLDFEVHPSDLDENATNHRLPEQLVEQLALEKARAVAARFPEALTLGADTIVVLDGDVLNKPADEAEARAMLRRLSGRTHTVYTGVALVHPASQREVVDYEATQVTFAPLTDAEIDAYVATGSPLDKAGAYGIQDDYGAVFIRRIEGDYYNVVGLPLHRLYRMLRNHFADLIED
ncbi:Maf family protein [Rhodothermus marinus]|uniref:Maf family protein n=1 Tax=Rhodothermus marinus TaxID=29549 RepID=UPI000223D9AD|nr:Maf family protein [Rhodothermus marinus]AEN73486.1 Septum formation protein Maf [Rhodothermus marinus SG0.5JP17-172]MBO2491219.1 septum formation inhibitor Maf [Rhodothermus marinus]BBM69823.1 Maf-like protein [Rhodothermus marinus]BBM72809.1 Maf-like protein [Rhodothermus marinus]